MTRFSTIKAIALLLALTALLCLTLPSSGATADAVQTLGVEILPEHQEETKEPPLTSAASMALLDPAQGVFLVQHDADTRRPMASTTKIMTALVVLELLPLDQIVTVPSAAVGIEGSSIYLFAGEQTTVRTLLYALLLSSANDAAVALALHTAGSIEAFAEQMNRKAQELGLVNTHFTNPHGLHDEEHYTTARELALLCAAAMENAVFAEIVATKRYSAPQNGTDATRLFLNHNRLLRTLDGAIGVKTGYTKAGGRCLVSAARRDGLTLIAVTLNDPNDWQDHTALLEWGFSQYVAFSPTPPSLTLPVVGGDAESVALRPSEPVYLTLPASHGAITCAVELPRFLYAPVAQGTAVGSITYYMNEEILAQIPLVAASQVDSPRAPTLWARIKRFFKIE